MGRKIFFMFVTIIVFVAAEAALAEKPDIFRKFALNGISLGKWRNGDPITDLHLADIALGPGAP